jgi:hypothetical protein
MCTVLGDRTEAHMARRHRSDSYSPAQRDLSTLYTHTRSLDALLTPVPLSPMPTLSPSLTRAAVLGTEDRRMFDPLASTSLPAAARPDAARLVPSRAPNFVRLNFQNPAAVAVCVRRKVRREVLFATKKRRKGARGRKHYNYWSQFGC